MKKVSLVLIFALTAFITQAQDISAAIVPIPSESWSRVNEIVTTGLTETKRLSLVSTDDWGLPGGDAALPAALKKAKSLGVTYVIIGNVDRAVKDNWIENDFTLKVYKVSTGEFFATKAFKITIQIVVYGDDMQKMFSKLKNEVRTWGTTTFSGGIELIKITKRDDKHGATFALISAGSDAGLSRGKTHYQIVEYTTEKVGDRTVQRPVKLGIGEIYKIESNDFAVLAVKNGGLVVEDRINTGTRLFLIPMPDK